MASKKLNESVDNLVINDGEIKSITADHLMEVSEDGMESLAKNNVIAVLLPGTTFFLGKKF